VNEQASFEGWAVVEIMGHNKEIGFVRTEYFGGPALFRVDQPGFPEREYVLERPQWIGDTHAPIGTKVQREALPGKTTYVGPSAVFRLTPCDEDTARRAIERMMPSPIKILHIPENAKLVTAGAVAAEQDFDLDDDPDDNAIF
jgi:hypothetical protein